MDFDPYAEWLQIAAGRRPPNHYELLGLPDFTDDTEAIRAASMQRSGQVRKFNNGPHRDEAIRIEREMAGAMVCLTDRDRKRRYDQTLRGGATVNSPVSSIDTLVDEWLAPTQPSTQISPAEPAAIPQKSTIATEPPGANVARGRPKQVQPKVERPSLAAPSPSPMSPAQHGWFKPAAWQWIAMAGAAMVLLGLALLGGADRGDEPTANVDLAGTNSPDVRLSSPEPIELVAKQPAAALAPPAETPTSDPPPLAKTPADIAPAPTSTPPVTSPPIVSPPPALAPFSTDQARAQQKAWAAHLGVPVEYDNSIGMKFVLIPPGEFLMGSAAGDVESPQRKVVLAQPVYLGVHEVTQAQYELVAGQYPSHFAATGYGKDSVIGLDTSTHPVEMVSWNDATEFCAKLSEIEKLTPYYFSSGATVTTLEGAGYRLPTEAQWEFACRAGTTTNYWTGDKNEDLPQAGWFNVNAGGRTHAVGELKANPFGLFDIHGNVGEWVQDGWESSEGTQIKETPAIDPGGPKSDDSPRVIRGGSWFNGASASHASRRNGNDPTAGAHLIGFRVTLAVDAVKAAIAEGRTSPARATFGWHGWPADAPPPALAPFSASKARTHQAAWAAHLGVPMERENTIGMKFVLIPPGEFLMGGEPADVEAEQHDGRDALVRIGAAQVDIAMTEGTPTHVGVPRHKVILTRPVYLGVYEVTQAQYEKVMMRNPSYYYATKGAGKGARGGTRPGSQRLRAGSQTTPTEPSDEDEDMETMGPTYSRPAMTRDKGATATYPVEMVTWNDAAEFCAKLSAKENLKPFYRRRGETVTMLKGAGYRLATEAEWEFACRAGTTTNYWNGDRDEQLTQAAWCRLNLGGSTTHAVGELKGNPFGLYDMHGNVGEWVQDWWEPTYYARFREKPAIDPSGPSRNGDQRVFRGGSWYHNAPYCRSSSRGSLDPSNPNKGIGFRVVLIVGGSRAGR